MLSHLPIRKSDSYGSGAYGARRGRRKHKGVDLCCYPKTRIYAPASGEVVKLGYCYKDDLSYRYVRIKTDEGELHRVMYVEPTVEVGHMVIAEIDVIGEAQDLRTRYPRDEKHREAITNHVHYDIQVDGKFVDPTRKVK